MISPTIRRELLAVDWNFPRMHNGTFQTQHWYPGTFPTELPATLIQALTSPDDLVFDPYSGIGTTATEALRLGRRSWNVELNRAAALAAYVSGAFILLKRFQPRMVNVLLSALESTIARLEGGHLFQTQAVGLVPKEIDDHLRQLMIPSPQHFLNDILCDGLPNRVALERWFHCKTLEDVIRFSEILQAETTGIVRLFGTMCMSACLRPLSSQTRSWGHIADNALPKCLVEKRVSYSLRRWLSRFGSNINKTSVVPAMGRVGNGLVALQVDVFNWLNDEGIPSCPSPSVNLLLTSPPYGGAIDYVLSQRLSYYFFGGNDELLYGNQRNEIGARRKRSRKTSREIWASELSVALVRQAEFVDGNGSIVVVMPHKAEGRSNGNRIVDSTLNSLGWRSELAIDRSIRTVRTRQAWTSIKQETVNIYTCEEERR